MATRNRDYARELGGRIRAVRAQQGLSLHALETKSGGVWSAVVVGSYERADRMITTERLASLASFLGVPMAELLPPGPARTARPRLRFDLSALAVAPPEAASLRQWVHMISSLRGDWNGRVLSVRTSDLIHIAALLGESPTEALGLMAGWGVLAEKPDLDAFDVEVANTTGARR
ncbi:transcriptional regulator [Parafrankia sp. FMc2]|uniref:transcriptional regulator n=1 Tax=Parafrankia sp. FMc2 TaxID=3233196 RepID=UPI0034D778DB